MKADYKMGRCAKCSCGGGLKRCGKCFKYYCPSCKETHKCKLEVTDMFKNIFGGFPFKSEGK